MERIAIYNRKGGVGKSTTCLNVAGCLDAEFHKRVLVVDCDPQANVTTCLTLNSDINIEKSVADIFAEKKSGNFNDFIYPVIIPDKNDKTDITTNISIVAGIKQELDRVNTQDMFALKDFLDLFEDKFDYCLIDCPPSLNDVTINILCAADYIIVPSEAGRDGINGYGMVVDEVSSMKENGYNANAHILGIFLNKVDKRLSLHTYYSNLWQKDFKGSSFTSQIRGSSDVSNAYEFGKPVQYYKPNCKVAKDYERFTKELMKKIKDIKEGVR